MSNDSPPGREATLPSARLSDPFAPPALQGFVATTSPSVPLPRIGTRFLTGPPLGIQRSPDGFIPPFPNTLTTPAIGPEQLPAVWAPVLQPEPEGPALISHAAWLRSVDHFDLPPAPSWRTAVSVSMIALRSPLTRSRVRTGCLMKLGIES